MKTFKQLQDDALRWFDEVDNEDELRDNVKQAINAAHKARLTKESWPFMKWPQPVRFSTEADKQDYTLHQKFLRPIYFYNVTSQRWMKQLDDTTLVANLNEGSFESWLDGSSGTDWTSQAGTAVHYELRNISPLKTQLTEASTLGVTSSSGADGANQSVIVEGDTTDGVRSETIVCTTNGSVEFTSIHKVTKVGTWSGTMTLTGIAVSDSSLTTLLKLFSNETGRKYQVFHLFSTPTTAEVIEYHFYRQPNQLVEDNDIPDLPDGFEDLLVYDALIDLATYNDGQVTESMLKIWSHRQGMLEEGLINNHKDATALEKEDSYIRWQG